MSELDHDAVIHRADIAANGKLTVPAHASGGSAQTLARNYAPIRQEVALDVTGHLVPDAGHWIAEEDPDYFSRCPEDSARRAPDYSSGRDDRTAATTSRIPWLAAAASVLSRTREACVASTTTRC
jgi:hypothetical protein